MNRTKLVAFLLFTLSFGTALFAVFMAAGPFLLVRMNQYPDDLPPGCMAAAILLTFLFCAAILGSAGLVLWSRVVRKRARERASEVASWPAQEAALQSCCNQAALAVVDRRGSHEAHSLHRLIASLDVQRRHRWRRFLSTSEAPGELFLPGDALRLAEPAPIHEGGLRALAFALNLFGSLCLLWAVFTAMQQLFTRVSWVVAGMAPGPEGAWIGASGCLLPGLTSLFGGSGILWLLRVERRRRAKEEEYRGQARQVLLDGCVGRLQWLMARGLVGSPDGETLQKVARASLYDALAELDGGRKARLLSVFEALELRPVISLQGADLRGLTFPPQAPPRPGGAVAKARPRSPVVSGDGREVWFEIGALACGVGGLFFFAIAALQVVPLVANWLLTGGFGIAVPGRGVVGWREQAVAVIGLAAPGFGLFAGGWTLQRFFAGGRSVGAGVKTAT